MKEELTKKLVNYLTPLLIDENISGEVVGEIDKIIKRFTTKKPKCSKCGKVTYSRILSGGKRVCKACSVFADE